MTDLDSTVASVARIVDRGVLSPERAALAERILNLYERGDRDAARAVLEEWNLMPGQPVGSASVKDTDI